MPEISISTHYPDHCSVHSKRWLEVASRLDPRFGGISAVIPELCESTRAAGTHVRVAGFCSPDEDTGEIERCGVPFTRFPLGTMRWGGDRFLRRRLVQLLQSSDGLHIHGIWDDHCAASGALARSVRKPYIVSAHGMLDSWALNQKWLKKWFYSVLIEKNNLQRASCLHALTRAEVDDYRRFGLKNPVAVIPNGVDIPRAVSAEEFMQAFPHLRGRRLIVFLSRLHRKKGLDILCKAWFRLHRKFGDAHLVLAGPDFENTRSAVQSCIDELGLGESASFTGMLPENLKWSALAAAEMFVLPSYSEGFSVAVLEALGMGVPVVISYPCNFPEVENEGCGRVINPNAAELEEALRDFLTASRSDLGRIGDRGRQLVASRYTWAAVGRRLAELYDWVLGGPEPLRVPIF